MSASMARRALRWTGTTAAVAAPAAAGVAWAAARALTAAPPPRVRTPTLRARFLDADVVALQEIENNAGLATQTLVDALNEDAGSPVWAALPNPEGYGTEVGTTDAITNAIIYRTDAVTPATPTATVLIDEAFDNARAPYAGTFTAGGAPFTVISNHFKSKGSSCTDVAGPGFGFGDDVETALTGNCNLTREYAAERLVEWVETKPTGVTTPDTFVIGDLNSYQQEGPIRTFLDAGYEDAVATRGDDAATYKFDGRYGRLDYVLASPSAKRLLDDAAVWQANSAEPYGYLYYLDPVDDSAFASSDHDPVVASLDAPGKSGRRGRR